MGHYIRKSQENFARGYYSPDDIRRLLYNLRINYTTQDVRILQTKLYEYNIVLNKLIHCNATDIDLDTICSDHQIQDKQTCKNILNDIQFKICPVRNSIYDNIYRHIYRIQQPYYGLPILQRGTIVSTLPTPIIFQQQPNIIRLPTSPLYMNGGNRNNLHEEMSGGWPLTPKNSSLTAHVVDFIQLIFDMIGLVPGIGAPFDIVSGIISTLKGDFWWQGAGSFIAVIPIIGDFTGAPIKYISKYNKYKKSYRNIKRIRPHRNITKLTQINRSKKHKKDDMRQQLKND